MKTWLKKIIIKRLCCRSLDKRNYKNSKDVSKIVKKLNNYKSNVNKLNYKLNNYKNN